MANILVVDDSRLSRIRMRDALAGAGHNVITANDGQEGLDTHAAHQPDCILLDLLMPGVNGQEFLQRLRASGSDTPVIISTADIQDSTRAIVEKLGISAFLNKPVKAFEYVEAVETVLKSREVFK